MADLHNEPKRILVEVHTSSPTFDKASEQPFNITLSAKVDHVRSVTIDGFMSVLYRRSAALDHAGLTFKDIDTGELAERRDLHAVIELPERLAATTSSVIQLPPRDTSNSYTVSHEFVRGKPLEPSPTMNAFEREMLAAAADLGDQTVGLIPGHTYEIGLGTQMSLVRWWREGNKAEVFLRGSLSRQTVGEPLQMELVKTAQFRVVGEQSE